jgi:membrane protease YdiL (CAAX protease family)
MLENLSTPAKSVLFFITRLFILAGMVMFFSAVFYVAGVFLCKWIYGYDFITAPQLLNTFKDDIYVVRALKFLQVFFTIGAMIIPAWYFPRALEQDSASFVRIKKNFNPVFIGLPIAIIFVSIPLVAWLIEVNNRFSLPASFASWEAKLKAAQEATEELSKAFVASTTTGELLANMFIIAIVPAIAEELLFRGALQQFVLYCFKNKHAAVISSAIIFSAFHGEIYGFLPRFVLGALLGYLFVYSGSLWPSVIAHFLNNALTLLSVHFHWDEGSLAFLKEDYQFPVYIVVLSTLLTAATIYFMHYKRTKEVLYNGKQLG